MMPLKLAQTAQKPQVRFAEQGRSMVEILGVLSIMGILSLMGLKMYHNAINSHRANELIYEANKRATMVAAQIMAGRTNLSIAEFNNNLGYGTFGEPTYSPGSGRFIIPLTGVEEEVCTQMKTSLGENFTMAIGGTCGADLALTFNDNLSTGVFVYEENAAAKACTSDADCNAAQFCSDNKCVSKCKVGAVWANITANDCVPGISPCQCVALSGTNPSCNSNTDCMYGAPNDNLKGCCVNGICAAEYQTNTCPTKNKICRSNADCHTPTEYCSITSNSYTCATPDTGTCLSVNGVAVPSSDVYDGQTLLFEKNTFVKGLKRMTFWAAENFCKAQGKRLINFADVGITNIPENSCGLTYGNTCPGINWEAFRNAFGAGDFWTTNLRDRHCSVWYLRASSATEAFSVGGYHGFAWTLCH